MKKMFYAVAVVAAMAVCSCGNKAQNTEATEIVEETIELATPCDSCKEACDSCKSACDSCKSACDSCKEACDSCKEVCPKA